jgi:polyisoprenoid-binding protein YceI
MRTRTFVHSALALGALGSAAVMTSAPAQTPAQPTMPAPSRGAAYDVDPVHSAIVFGITHMGAGYFYGRFNEPAGTFSFNADDPSTASFDIKLLADRVDTGNGKRDGHLKSADFFNAKQFPDITFKSTSVKKQGKGFQVAGNLTLHGVTKPVTAELEHIGSKTTERGAKCGFRGSFKIKRSDFGITFMPDGLGDEVTVLIGLEGSGK